MSVRYHKPPPDARLRICIRRRKFRMLVTLQLIVAFLAIARLLRTPTLPPGSETPRMAMLDRPKHNVNITLAGMSYSDSTTSDFAVRFLVEAACNHGIQSFVLLKERDAESSLTMKVSALAHHMQLVPTDGVVNHPTCSKLIHIEQSFSDEQLLNLTRSRMQRDTRLQYELNNPLDADNRIARIKRSREYQREELRNLLALKEMDKARAVIAVLDLDMYSYPSPATLIDAARKYIVPPSKTSMQDVTSQNDASFHAICSNGVFVRVKENDYYDIRHYDTYSTILLPDNWLYREPGSSKQKRKGGNTKGLRPMNQSETYQYIMQEGIRPPNAASETNSYDPVPVRSCFGGLTLYRADVWFDAECKYDAYHEDDAAFTSGQYQHACEHVVFHECLRRKMVFKIAVQPDLTTLWHTT